MLHLFELIHSPLCHLYWQFFFYGGRRGLGNVDEGIFLRAIVHSCAHAHGLGRMMMITQPTTQRNRKNAKVIAPAELFWPE